jgi:hypothetical protein
VFFGIGSSDSAIVNLAERPSTLADLRAYIETVRALDTKGETTWRGRMVRLTWAKRAIPIYLSAEGPRSKASTSHPRCVGPGTGEHPRHAVTLCE